MEIFTPNANSLRAAALCDGAEKTLSELEAQAKRTVKDYEDRADEA